MGRRKVPIQPLGNRRQQQITFAKRRAGLLKKAYELSTLCDCEIGIIIFSANDKLFQYASSSMEGVLHRYMATVRAQETVTNADMSLRLSSTEQLPASPAAAAPDDDDANAAGLPADDGTDLELKPADQAEAGRASRPKRQRPSAATKAESEPGHGHQAPGSEWRAGAGMAEFGGLHSVDTRSKFAHWEDSLLGLPIGTDLHDLGAPVAHD